MTELTTLTDVDEHTELQLAAARARRRLVEAPAIIGWVRAQMTPSMGGAQDGMPKAASKSAPLPLREDAVDLSDDAFNRILYWVRVWADIFHEQGPAPIVTHWNVQGEAKGFRAGVTAEGATGLTRIATTWLLARQYRIETESAPRDQRSYFDDVSSIVWDLRARYDRAPRSRQVIERACPVCDHLNLAPEWPDQPEVQHPELPPAEDFILRCSHCDHWEPGDTWVRDGRVRELSRTLREEASEPRSEWWTKAKAVSELGVSTRIVEMWIKGGLPVYTAGGQVHVNVEELLELYRAKRVSAKASRFGAKS